MPPVRTLVNRCRDFRRVAVRWLPRPLRAASGTTACQHRSACEVAEDCTTGKQQPQQVEGCTESPYGLDIRSSAADDVHHDPDNLPLFRTAAESVSKRVASGLREAPELRVLDLGSGSGIWGLLVAARLRQTVELERHTIRLVFADVAKSSVDLSLANAARSREALNSAHADAFVFDGFVGDMFDAVLYRTMLPGGRLMRRERLKDQQPFDVILFNPPQTGGHDAFRTSRYALEKYGGEDGSLYYRRFAREVGSLAHDKTACVFAQIGLANPARVERSFRSAGFDSITELARQQRTTTVSEHITARY